MPRILYIFPHPDDESFGPGPALARQRRQGHEVYLLTLTHGEATKQRHRFGYSKEEMGAVRRQEMDCVVHKLDLTDLTVLDFPDGDLDGLNPLVLATALEAHFEKVKPAVVVTYAVHGISGHPDHLVAHALVKHVYCTLKARGVAYLKRLAFFTLSDGSTVRRPAHLRGSPPEAIDCIVPFGAADRAQGEAALACYRTYRTVVDEHDPMTTVAEGVCFEFFEEQHDPPLEDLCEGIDAAG